MLEVDLRDLARGPVETRGVLAADDPVLLGTETVLARPVAITGRLQAAGEGRFYWHGRLQAVVAAECRRCLAPVTVPLAVEIGALFSQEPGAADDPETYPVERDAGTIDVRGAVREELILALPKYVVCREDCRGLCPRCGKDLNAGPCGCTATATDTRWQALAALKDKFRD
ncbi:MAG TPA: DUF177 domain-containing protein [Gemmatimonadales bacterium]